jgi:hypothetical protein
MTKHAMSKQSLDFLMTKDGSDAPFPVKWLTIETWAIGSFPGHSARCSAESVDER